MYDHSFLVRLLVYLGCLSTLTDMQFIHYFSVFFGPAANSCSYEYVICSARNSISCQGTVVLGVSVRRTLTWMRKVVGSNPGDNLYRMFVFFLLWIDWKKETSIFRRETGNARLRKNRRGTTTMRWSEEGVVRINLLREEKQSGAIYRVL